MSDGGAGNLDDLNGPLYSSLGDCGCDGCGCEGGCGGGCDGRGGGVMVEMMVLMREISSEKFSERVSRCEVTVRSSE